MKIKNSKLTKFLVVLFVFLGMLLISNTTKASSDLNLKQLNFDIQLNSDGSMDITETWKIKIRDTNTLFKTFHLLIFCYCFS